MIETLNFEHSEILANVQQESQMYHVTSPAQQESQIHHVVNSVVSSPLQQDSESRKDYVVNPVVPLTHTSVRKSQRKIKLSKKASENLEMSLLQSTKNTQKKNIMVSKKDSDSLKMSLIDNLQNSQTGYQPKTRHNNANISSKSISFNADLESRLPIHLCACCDEKKGKYDMMVHPISILDPCFNLLKDNSGNICLNCSEIKDNQVYICKLCNTFLKKGKIPLFSIFNNQWGEIPECLQRLNYMERKMIAPYNINTKLVIGSQYSQIGGIAYVMNDIAQMAQILPRAPKDTGIILVTPPQNIKKWDGSCTSYSAYEVRKEYIITSLNWCLKNNKIFQLLHSKGLQRFDFDVLNRDLEPSILEVPESFVEELEAMSTMNKVGKDAIMIDINEETNVNKDISKQILNLLRRHKKIEDVKMNEGVFVLPNNIPVKPYEEKYFWEGCFPCLFPYGQGGPTDLNRPVPYKMEALWDRHALRESSQRLAKDMNFLFGRYKYKIHKNISGALYRVPIDEDDGSYCLMSDRVRTDCQKLIDGYDENDDIDNLVNHMEVLCKNVKGTYMSMKEEKGKLMSRLKSPEMSEPTWFSTITSGDLCWPELFMSLDPSITYEKAQFLSKDTRKKMLQENPVMAARIFKLRIASVLKTLLKKNGGHGNALGILQDYWFRYEFQDRGSPHLHGLLWSNLEHPDYGSYDGNQLCNLMVSKNIEDRRKLCEIVDQYVSCSVPENKDTVTFEQSKQEVEIPIVNDDEVCGQHPSLVPFCHISEEDIENKSDLIKLLGALQLHDKHHRPTCRKYGRQKCRFDFPRKLVEKTKVARIKRRSKWQISVVLRRNNRWINNYNTKCLYNIRSNMDFQFIANPSGVASYATGAYICKHEQPDKKLLSNKLLRLLGSETSQVIQNRTVRNKLYIAGISIMDCTQISAQEAAWNLLGYPIVECSKPVIDVKVSPPESKEVTYTFLTRTSQKNQDMNEELLSQDILLNQVDTNVQCKIVEEYMRLQNCPEDLSLYSFLTAYKPVKQQTKDDCDDENTYGVEKVDEVEDECEVIHTEDYVEQSPWPYILNSDEKMFVQLPSNKRRVLRTCPFILPNPKTIEGAWSLLMLHSKHWDNILNFGELSNAIETLQKYINDGKMCPSLERCLQSYNKDSIKSLNQQSIVEDLEVIQLQDSTSNDEDEFKSNSEVESFKYYENDDDEIDTISQYHFDNKNNCCESIIVKNVSSNRIFFRENDVQFLSTLEYNNAESFIKVQSNKRKEFDEREDSNHVKSKSGNKDFEGHCINKKSLDKLQCLRNQLNNQQDHAFRVIVSHLCGKNSAARNVNLSSTPNWSVMSEENQRDKMIENTQLRMILSGAGGVGKTFLIEVVTLWAKLYYGKSKSLYGPVLLVAPTGKAAIAIKGRTLYSTFFVHVYKGNFPNKKALQTLQRQMKGVKLLILDEMSMVGVQDLGKLERLLRNIFNVKLPFGGIHFLCAGDFYQLPPVGGDPMYVLQSSKHPKNSAFSQYKRNINIEMGEEAYQMFDTFIELTIQQRQTKMDLKNLRFKELLTTMRIGMTSSTIEDFLNSKIYDSIQDPNISKLPVKKTLFLAPTKVTVRDINLQQTRQLVEKHNKQCIHVWSHDSMIELGESKRKKSQKVSSELDPVTQRLEWWKIDPEVDSRNFNKLSPVLNLCIGSRVMITSNLATNLGICNGSLGTVCGFIYPDTVHNLKDFETNLEAAEKLQPLPIVLVEFDIMPSYTESYYKNKPNVFPISYSKCNLTASVERKQLPLTLGFCCTIHKAQGSSVDNVVCILEPFHSRGLLYVACSRVKSEDGLFFVKSSRKSDIISCDITGHTSEDINPYTIIQNVYTKLKGDMYKRAIKVCPIDAHKDDDPLDIFLESSVYDIMSWEYGIQNIDASTCDEVLLNDE